MQKIPPPMGGRPDPRGPRTSLRPDPRDAWGPRTGLRPDPRDPRDPPIGLITQAFLARLRSQPPTGLRPQPPPTSIGPQPPPTILSGGFGSFFLSQPPTSLTPQPPASITPRHPTSPTPQPPPASIRPQSPTILRPQPPPTSPTPQPPTSPTPRPPLAGITPEPPTDALTALENVVPCKELSAIVESALNSLQVIEPWREASTNHPQLQQVIQKIQDHSIIYFDAIDTSLKTVQDGYDFSSDVIELCGYLLDPDTDPADLQAYIVDMQGKAKWAREDSTTTLDKFREVRKGLIEITKAIPKEALAAPEGGKGFFLRVRSWVVGGEQRDMELDTAIKELNLAALDMVALSDNVDKFAKWWGGMEMVLGKAEKDARGLKPAKNTLRVKQIRKTWTGIQEDYKQYRVQVVTLQDHDPSHGREIEASKDTDAPKDS